MCLFRCKKAFSSVTKGGTNSQLSISFGDLPTVIFITKFLPGVSRSLKNFHYSQIKAVTKFLSAYSKRAQNSDSNLQLLIRYRTALYTISQFFSKIEKN
jgi:hypothetical protein